MPLPDAIIEEANGNLGTLLELADGVAGFVLTGATAGSITVGTPIEINGFDDAVAKGLASATNAFAYKVVKEHYDQAPNTQIYLMLVSNAMTVNLMADKTNANGARKLLDFAEGKVRLLFCMDDPTSHTVTVTNGLDANVYTAKTNMQALAIEYAGSGKQAPFWGFIGGTGYSGTASALTDQNLSSDDYVSIMIGDTASGTAVALGLLSGRLAANPVQRKPSRVKSKNLVIPGGAAYLNTTLVEKATDIATIHDKGYITLRKFPNKNGYFFTSDYTCTASTSDFKRGTRRRVMNKVHIIAYAQLVEEVDDEVPVEADGKIDASYGSYLEGQVENQINGIMVANRELSSFTASVDLNQNVLSTNETVVVLAPVPVGYNEQIRGKIAFKNPAIA